MPEEKLNPEYGDVTSDSIDTERENIGQTAHLSEGSDLGQLISDAIDNGYAAIHVQAKSDGTDWAWDTDVTFDTNDQSYLVVVADNVTIDYTGTGRPITVVDSSSGDGFGGETRFRLVGGRWKTSGSPTQWIRLDDQVGYYLFPRFVDFQGTSATCVEVRNDAAFSELGVIEGTYRAKNGIDFVPASVTGGSGTPSFQGTTIRDVRVNVSEPGGFCIRLRGNFKYCDIRRPNLFPSSDNATGLVLATDGGGTGLLGTTITSMQAEAGGDVTGAYAVLTEDPYDGFYSGLFIQPKIGGDTVDVLDPDSSDDRLPALRYSANAIDIGNWATDTWSTIGIDSANLSTQQLTTSGRVKAGEGVEMTDFNGKVRFTGGGGHGFRAGGTDVLLLGGGGISQNLYNPADQSGNTGSNPGETRLDDGTNTTHGDPDLVIWNGSAWRQVGTTNTFS